MMNKNDARCNLTRDTNSRHCIIVINMENYYLRPQYCQLTLQLRKFLFERLCRKENHSDAPAV